MWRHQLEYLHFNTICLININGHCVHCHCAQTLVNISVFVYDIYVLYCTYYCLYYLLSVSIASKVVYLYKWIRSYQTTFSYMSNFIHFGNICLTLVNVGNLLI